MALDRAALDNFYEDRKPYLETVIGLNFQEHEMIYPKILNMETMDTGWVDMASVSSFGLWAEKPELADAEEDDIIQGPVARAKALEYAKRHIVSQSSIEDDLGDGIIASRMPGIMRTGRATMEVLAHDMLNSGFSTAADPVLTPDGISLFNSAHKNLMQSTYDNLGTPGDVGQASLQEAILLLETMRDDRNIPIVQTAKTLIHHPSQKWLTQVVLGSAQVVSSPNNDINPMFTQGLTTVETPYLTDNEAWFLQADSHDLNWYTRIAPENWSEVNYRNGSVEVGARFRCATAAWDPRGIVGNAGS